MNLNAQNNTTSFTGKLILKQYTQKGAEKSGKIYNTTPVQDKLVKIVANSMTQEGFLSNRLNIEQSNIFLSLMEMIIKKPLKVSGQQKLMDNNFNTVVFSDKEPGRGGMIAFFNLNE